MKQLLEKRRVPNKNVVIAAEIPGGLLEVDLPWLTLSQTSCEFIKYWEG